MTAFVGLLGVLRKRIIIYAIIILLEGVVVSG